MSKLKQIETFTATASEFKQLVQDGQPIVVASVMLNIKPEIIASAINCMSIIDSAVRLQHVHNYQSEVLSNDPGSLTLDKALLMRETFFVFKLLQYGENNMIVISHPGFPTWNLRLPAF